MPARVLTLIISSVVSCVLVVAAAVLPVPYVALGPGPIFDTLGESDGQPLITVTGGPTYDSAGELDLTTVSVVDKITLGEALRSWFDGDVAVVPRDLVFPPSKSEKQVEQENTQDMVQSQQSATVVALDALGLESTDVVTVTAVVPGSAAVGNLQEGDLITAVDGAPVTMSAEVVSAVSAKTPGQPVVVGLTRDGVTKKVTLTTRAGDGDPARSVIGAQVSNTKKYPLTVDIELDNVGGPSAGLMFALGIYDTLTEGDLTGGRDIAGTGTIDDSGTVGPIGGIRQKLVGARTGGASFFLVPADNCAEAVIDPPSGLRLVKVDDFGAALSAVTGIGKGQTASLPSC